MSNFLAVDTSSRHLTVVAQNGRLHTVNHIEDCAMNHSVVLMDEIDKTLAKAGLTPADCDYFIAVTGPGSFTGIRIGISCIKGFASALKKKAAGVTVFDMLSYNINSGKDYAVAVDAGHGNFYVCGYTSGRMQDITPCYLSAEKLISLKRPIYGFEALDLPDYIRLSIKDCLYPAVQRCGVGGELRALYVKKSQAEEERLARLRTR